MIKRFRQGGFSTPEGADVIDSKSAPAGASDVAVAAARATADAAPVTASDTRWQARFDLERYRAETERLRILAEFLARPVHAHGGAEPDPDIITAYNLAVEAALQGIRRAAAGAD
jgi:hypothetical protein